MKPFKSFIIFAVVLFGLLGCAVQPEPDISSDPGALKFDSEQALVTETEFVTQFPNRDSGQPNNRLAAEWLQTQFSQMGLNRFMQEWEVINFSRPLPLNNVICSLPGESPKEIVVVAHHVQFSGTIQGADNDGTGIAVMLELAKIFTAEDTPAYTLTFVSSDGEEYGMLGSAHYIANHSNPEQIIAAFSLDNLGKEFYDGVRMSATGQLRDVGPLWLQRTAQEAARAAGDIWLPAMKPTYEQLLGFVKVPFNDIAALAAALDKNTAAVLLETVPATYGILVPEERYLAQVHELCDQHGALLIADEVQSWLGRTGKLWAVQHYDVQPDILVMGKGLSGGIYPISATCFRAELDHLSNFPLP